MRSPVLKVFLFTALPVVIVFGCGGVLGEALAASQIPTAGLVAYYPFNGNTNDASGNGFHCISHGAVLTSDRSSRPNSAYAFNGVDAFIECPTSPRLGVHVGVNMTVSTWVKPTEVHVIPFLTQIVISKYRYFVPETSDFFVGLNRSDGEIGRSTQITVTGVGVDAVHGDPPSFNRWSHIAVVFRGKDGTASVYLDGNLVGTGALTYNTEPSPENLLIGSSPAPLGEDSYFGGSIDDVRIYERALSGTEIRALASERPALLNDRVTLAPDIDTAFDPTPMPEAPAGPFTITAIFTNTNNTPLHGPFFVVTELSGSNLVLNADEGAQGVGATVTPDVGDSVLSPGETVAVDFVIGLHTRERFTFFVDLYGDLVP